MRGGPDADLRFCETLELPAGLPAPDLDDPGQVALVRACHLTFGISYYKAALPGRIVFDPPAYGTLDAAEVEFYDRLYSEGLGEFHFRNGLSVPDGAGFAAAAAMSAAAAQSATGAPGADRIDADLPAPKTPHAGSLVLIGGGKDSGLVAELVRASGEPAAALALGNSPWMERSAAAAGLTLHRIGRQIDPALLALNARGAWNGHVPISACIAAVSTLVARAAGFRDVLVGNERGADDANLQWQGRAVNHQWSKSSRFERSFQQLCQRTVGPWPRYASLLRPLSEIRIAAAFARCTAQHDQFTSCNRNFRLDPRQRPQRWCTTCAKCVFVALILTPHLTDQQRDAIFGADLLAAPENRTHLLALLALADVKPWDCVGTARECWLSLLTLARQQRLPAGLLDLLAHTPADLQGAGFAEAWQDEWQVRASPLLPPEWQERLHAYLGAD